jgi:hypothetical protein
MVPLTKRDRVVRVLRVLSDRYWRAVSAGRYHRAHLSRERYAYIWYRYVRERWYDEARDLADRLRAMDDSIRRWPSGWRRTVVRNGPW